MQKIDKHIAVKKLENEAIKRPLKIPRILPDQLLQNVTELRLFSYWLALKPIFYSGVIIDARNRKKEIAIYLQITERSLNKYIALMIERGLITENKRGDFSFISWRKFFDLYSLEYNGGRSFFYFDNDYLSVEYLIRTHILKHNTEKQKYTFYRRFFTFCQYENYVEGEIVRQAAESPNKAKKIGLQPMDRFAADLTHKLKTRKQWRKLFRQFCDDPNTIYKALRRAEGRYRCGDLPDYSPIFTLSCKGVARMFNRSSVSTGYYWERRLKSLGYLQILPVSISGNPMLELEGVEGCYSKRSKRSGKKWYRIRLSNQLAFLI